MKKASKVLSALYPADEYLLRIKKKSLPCQQKEREAYEPNLTTTLVGRAWPRSSCVLEICLAWWDQKEAASALKYQACPHLSMAYGSTDGK